jgi:hypothetical protein
VGESQSDSSGQSNVASIVLDQNSIMRAAVKGVDGQSPEETRRNAALNNKMLRASRTDAQNASADAFAAQAMEGWTVADFGGGAKGQAIMDFAKNVFFEHGSIQSVTGSMTAQKPLNQLVGGVHAQEAPIEKLKNLPSSSLGSGFQAGFGQNYIESADRKNFIRYMQLPTAAQSNAVNSAQAYAELKDKTNKTQEEITWIAGASALGKTIGLANATGQGRTKPLGQ